MVVLRSIIYIVVLRLFANFVIKWYDRRVADHGNTHKNNKKEKVGGEDEIRVIFGGTNMYFEGESYDLRA